LAKRICDILIGTRGGMWFAFTNSRQGTAAIRAKTIAVNHPNAEAAQRACEAVGLTWMME
jgi:hypothetical protein